MTEPSLDRIWTLLLAARGQRDRLREHSPTFGLSFFGDTQPEITGADDANAALVWRGDKFDAGPGLPPEALDFVELYLPVLAAQSEHPVVVGHLGQSIDAQIATRSGDSCYVTGKENLTHLHRMRALCDAIVVGAGTVAADDPRLTTRLVAGPNPVRIVIDTERRLSGNQRIFSDADAETLLVCCADRISHDELGRKLIAAPRQGRGLDLRAVLEALTRRGLHSLFIEGGGVTVSRWMKAGLLDRLQIATAPVIIGAGRPGLSLPASETMRACRRPPYKLFKMGDDILWDFDLRGDTLESSEPSHHRQAPMRLH
ncbi:deaminase [Thiorhodococcus mannitoliphagus]|uniref:Deaminase n=1 Tax=Thiorhodococcus mannitoliphagus TaxID=329406 RepID=A0A6P1DPX4_9GAMM|nr:dihydrofolate reductase family protein [Thiorhodococcus mannitoliphagus]NEX18971.1 deaminase [Thiorhodococcus mannitoliphagus]